MKRGKKTDRQVRNYVGELWRENPDIGPRKVSERVREEFPDRDLPGYRSYQRMLATFGKGDTSPPWTFPSESIEDDRLVLETLAAIIYSTHGQKLSLSMEEADRIAWVRKMAPGLDPWPAWIVAKWYIIRHRQHEDTKDLDHYLAFTPWKSREHQQRYEEAQFRKSVEPPPSWELTGGFEQGFGETLQRWYEGAFEDWQKEKQTIRLKEALAQFDQNRTMDNLKVLKDELSTRGKDYPELRLLKDQLSAGGHPPSVNGLLTILKDCIEKDIMAPEEERNERFDNG